MNVVSCGCIAPCCAQGTLAMPFSCNRNDLSYCHAVEVWKPSRDLTLNYHKVQVIYSQCHHPCSIRRSVLPATDLFMPLKKQPVCLVSLAGFLQYISLAKGKPAGVQTLFPVHHILLGKGRVPLIKNKLKVQVLDLQPFLMVSLWLGRRGGMSSCCYSLADDLCHEQWSLT